MPISSTKRQRNKVEDASKGGSGLGGKVPFEQMVAAARVWLDLEGSKSQSRVSALAVGKGIHLNVAPEWLDSDRFIRILEVERFRRRVLQLKALPELTSLIQNVIDLGLIEAQKRLVLSPGEIPNSTLFGDILFKLPKMVQDFTAGDKPVRAGDIMLTVVKEINLIGDPRTRDLVRKQLMGNLDDIARAVNDAGLSQEVVDADHNLLHVDGVDDADGPNVLPLARPVLETTDGPDVADSELWSDPALD
jgi:hypothetical protein